MDSAKLREEEDDCGFSRALRKKKTTVDSADSSKQWKTTVEASRSPQTDTEDDQARRRPVKTTGATKKREKKKTTEETRRREREGRYKREVEEEEDDQESNMSREEALPTLIEVTRRLVQQGEFNQGVQAALERLTVGAGLPVGGQRDQHGRTEEQARRDYREFSKLKPTFERGRDRWVDFARRFNGTRLEYMVTDQQAKWVLFTAIVGSSSRLVISSMDPTVGEWAGMTFQAYIQRMGEKFTPASESLQMEAEYKARKQGKNEDVQNYINAKHELFQLAYPDAQPRAIAEFYREATKGFLNKGVRDQMFYYEAASVEAFGARAVSLVQIERMRIKLGDSDTTSMDGLIPVTKPMNEEVTRRKPEPMEVDALNHRWAEDEEDDDEEWCECAAMQEKGFRGPCYYCSRQGHLARSCPRRAAGLPKVLSPGTDGQKNDKRMKFQNKSSMAAGTSRNGTDRNKPSKAPFRRFGAKPTKRVQQLDEEEEEEPENGEGEEDAEDGEDGGATHFLGDLAL